MSRARGASPIATLSAREQSILALVAEGRSDESIRQHLDLQRDAFQAELREVFARLGLGGTRDDFRGVVAALGYLRSTV
jgi:DNA-binding CsgD family transcriptional regulator